MSAASTPPLPNPAVQAGWKVSLGIVLVLVALLAVGWVLPGAWSAEASRMIAAPADSVFALLDSPRRWDEWTPWPDIEFSYQGPERGAGASRSWDAPAVGAGSFTIVETESPARVRYQVALAGEAQPTEGEFRLERSRGGTNVHWSEAGDFGGGPMGGWVALSMRRRHAAQLGQRLEALASAAEARPSR